jgi:hypothetical protein
MALSLPRYLRCVYQFRHSSISSIILTRLTCLSRGQEGLRSLACFIPKSRSTIELQDHYIEVIVRFGLTLSGLRGWRISNYTI